MANRIKGITVEIGGDTTKLSKALEGVNKTIKNSVVDLIVLGIMIICFVVYFLAPKAYEESSLELSNSLSRLDFMLFKKYGIDWHLQSNFLKSAFQH